MLKTPTNKLIDIVATGKGSFGTAIKMCFAILIFFSHNLTFAQLLDNQSGTYIHDELSFNAEFIKANKIKTIKGQLLTKREMEIIKTSNRIYFYHFNEKGLLTKEYIIAIKEGIADTVVFTYHYNEKKQLIEERKSDRYGFYSYLFRYDEHGRLISTSYRRDQNIGARKTEFQLGEQYTITTESVSYEKIDEETVRKTTHNSYGKPYKQETVHSDHAGYINKVQTLYLISRKRAEVSYVYNEKGWLIERKETTNLDHSDDLTSRFSYDEVGNLIETNIFRNGEHKTVKQYLYDEKTLLLNAQLSNEVANNFMRIFKYEFEFYP